MDDMTMNFLLGYLLKGSLHISDTWHVIEKVRKPGSLQNWTVGAP